MFGFLLSNYKSFQLFSLVCFVSLLPPNSPLAFHCPLSPFRIRASGGGYVSDKTTCPLPPCRETEIERMDGVGRHPLKTPLHLQGVDLMWYHSEDTLYLHLAAPRGARSSPTSPLNALRDTYPIDHALCPFLSSLPA